MNGKEYRTLQLRKEDFDLLKEYCEYHDLKMGRFAGKLFQANCPRPKPAKGNVMKVEKKNEG